jgi:DNA-binding beta-propeller fold protein YncE
VVSLATDSVTATVTEGAAPFGIAFNHTGAKAYVTNGGSSTVSVVSAAGG